VGYRRCGQDMKRRGRRGQRIVALRDDQGQCNESLGCLEREIW
jgi:hypothetical protein